jgi:hypothetical protein
MFIAGFASHFVIVFCLLYTRVCACSKGVRIATFSLVWMVKRKRGACLSRRTKQRIASDANATAMSQVDRDKEKYEKKRELEPGRKIPIAGEGRSSTVRMREHRARKRCAAAAACSAGAETDVKLVKNKGCPNGCVLL